MISMNINALRDAIGVSDFGKTDKVFTGVSTDSRSVKPGNCFFALPGEKFDSNKFVASAFEKGASCAVVNRSYYGNHPDVIKVDDTITALGKLANFYRNTLKAKVIAITGSAGKTTTRQMVHHVLSVMYKCHQAVKSFNNNIGLPLTLLGGNKDHEIIVAELGSNAPGEIEYLTKIAQPDIALVNNIYPAHLEGFGSIEAIIAEKASIFLGLKEGSKFLINGDYQPLVDFCSRKGFPFMTFGTSLQCDIRAEKIKSCGSWGTMTIEGHKITIPLAGKGNIYNALAAWAIFSQFDDSKLGLLYDDFELAMREFKSVTMRMQVEKCGLLTILNDCYNANPASMSNALQCLQQIASEKKARSVFICGTMKELGAQSAKMHNELGKKALDNNIDVLLCIGEFSQDIADGASEGSRVTIEVFNNMDELCNNLKNFINSDDIVLVKGSRSVGLERIVAKLKELYL